MVARGRGRHKSRPRDEAHGRCDEAQNVPPGRRISTPVWMKTTHVPQAQAGEASPAPRVSHSVVVSYADLDLAGADAARTHAVSAG